MFWRSCIQLIHVQIVGSDAYHSAAISVASDEVLPKVTVMSRKVLRQPFFLPLHSQCVLAHYEVCFGSCATLVDGEADNPLECHPDNTRQKE